MQNWKSSPRGTVFFPYNKNFLCSKRSGRWSLSNRETWIFSILSFWRTYELIMYVSARGYFLPVRLITYIQGNLMIYPDRRKACLKVLICFKHPEFLIGRQGVVIIYLAFGLSSPYPHSHRCLSNIGNYSFQSQAYKPISHTDDILKAQTCKPEGNFSATRLTWKENCLQKR